MQNNLCPDYYLRYKIVFKIIKKIQGIKSCRILEIGGHDSILGNFIKAEKLPYDLTIIDIRKNTKEGMICDRYDSVDFLKAKIEKYDFAISLDVLEHIDKKEEFIKKSLAAAKIIIIGAPFGSKEVKGAEKKLNDFYKENMKSDHRWLREHLKSKLPDEKWFEKYLTKNGFQFVKKLSNNLDNWLVFMMANFFQEFYSLKDYKKIHGINKFYNEIYKELGDTTAPAYRNIYVISREKKINTIDKKIENSNLKNIFLSKIIDYYNSSLGNIGNFKKTINQYKIKFK